MQTTAETAAPVTFKPRGSFCTSGLQQSHYLWLHTHQIRADRVPAGVRPALLQNGRMDAFRARLEPVGRFPRYFNEYFSSFPSNLQQIIIQNISN